MCLSQALFKSPCQMHFGNVLPYNPYQMPLYNVLSQSYRKGASRSSATALVSTSSCSVGTRTSAATPFTPSRASPTCASTLRISAILSAGASGDFQPRPTLRRGPRRENWAARPRDAMSTQRRRGAAARRCGAAARRCGAALRREARFPAGAHGLPRRPGLRYPYPPGAPTGAVPLLVRYPYWYGAPYWHSTGV